MNKQFDIVIAGGGLNGPALGLALAQAGLNVAVVDAQPAHARGHEGFDGRAYALALASQQLLRAIGLWSTLADKAQPILHVRTRDSGGGGEMHFDGAEIEAGRLGYLVEDRHLAAALSDAMDVPDMAGGGQLTHRAGTRVTGQADAGSYIDVMLDNGETLRAALLVGADGRGSQTSVRAGITRLVRDYGQTAIVASFDHTKPHEGTAWQVFYPSGPLAVLPLTGDRSSIVWSMAPDEAEYARSLDDTKFTELVAPRLAPLVGDITLNGGRFSYPLNLTLAQSYIAPRVALIGDAAHGVHPIAGQGLNLGLRDVAALAECVIDARRRGEDIGNGVTLGRYQGWRRFDSTALAMGMGGVNALFSNDSAILGPARRLGMRIVGGTAPLRRRFMRQAAGLTLDPMPRLLTGRPL